MWQTLKLCAAFDDPTTLHELMFVPNIKALCSESQQTYWLPLCKDWRVVGCYAQTEVGHGSNVRALETTATYLPAPIDAFEVHTPTVTATKFWPGSMGRTANTAMVIARLRLPKETTREYGAEEGERRGRNRARYTRKAKLKNGVWEEEWLLGPLISGPSNPLPPKMQFQKTVWGKLVSKSSEASTRTGLE